MLTEDNKARYQHRCKTRANKPMDSAVTYRGDCSAKQCTKLDKEQIIMVYRITYTRWSRKLILFVQNNDHSVKLTYNMH